MRVAFSGHTISSETGPNYTRTIMHSWRVSSPPGLVKADGAGVASRFRALCRLRFGRASCSSSSEMVSHSDRRLRMLGCLLQPACCTPICLPDPRIADLRVRFLPLPALSTAGRLQLDGRMFMSSGTGCVVFFGRPRRHAAILGSRIRR